MKNKKVILLTSTVLTLILTFLYINNLYNNSNQKLKVTNPSPFLIDVSTPIIKNEPSGVLVGDKLLAGSEENNRLIISVSISPSTNEDFQNTWFEIEINPEMKPFIASQILKYKGDKFFVTTYEKASADSDSLKITGFESTWNLSLTSSKDLMTFYNFAPEDIYDALKSVTVRVIWDGGSQEETVSIRLDK